MLANRIIGLPAPYLLSFFISGLVPEIRREVQALHPLTLVQAASLSRLQEKKLADQCHGVLGGLCGRAPPNLASLLPPLPPTPPLLSSPAKPPLPHVRRLTLEEMTMHREKGLCFNCDEKFTRGHRCSSRIFLLIADPEEEDETPCSVPNVGPNIQDPPALDLTQAQISLYALSGHLAPETLHLLGRVLQQHVVILIDEGSTHNFVQE